MALKDLMPWSKRGEMTPVQEDPFTALRHEMDRLFEGFFRGLEVAPFKGVDGDGFWPKVNVTEDEAEVKVTAELPGLEEKDVEVFVTDDALTLKGEKKEVTEENEKSYFRSERSYGVFERTMPLPAAVQTDKVEAQFKNGVLTVKLPKTEEAKARKRKIPVHGG